jgi:Protein of unknown function (DUF2946)
MDEMVKAALRKWPDVPHCYGWLALDDRGTWYMRDERTQAAGAFPRPLGSAIQHDKLLDFIHRNYACDGHGAWYFQNGPQRVYVELQSAPFVWRIDTVAGGGWRVTAQNGLAGDAALAVTPRSVWLDEAGRLFLHADQGLGLVHSMDTGLAAVAIEQGHWLAQEMPFAQMPAHFGYVLRPVPPQPGKVI